MKTLYLMRHGKSAWDNPELADHERPLAPRGLRAAGRVGKHLRKRGWRPDLAITSTARRAGDTLDAVLDALGGGDTPVERERGLYLCGATVLLQRLKDLPDDAATALVVGHNPDLHDLARTLAKEEPVAGGRAALKTLSARFPTAACAVLAFPVTRWRDIEPHTARLVEFVQPRKLD